MSRKPSSNTSPASGAKTVRCAIYTRKSTEEGLDQEFNSLDAQRESAEAYIASQKNEGWTCLPERYDDGGFSGGTVERPALRRLLADIEAGLIDCVVVYKVDRLSRSLLDFAKLMDAFDRQGVAFSAVTQQFNTTHSMGRLTLNILLSFAQFEREIISERTRDKIAAARRKGKWAGGRPVLGYDVVHRPGGNTLAVNPEEAEQVRQIFALYVELGRVMPVVWACRDRGWTTKKWVTKAGKSQGGMPLSKNRILLMLRNVTYLGKVRHHDEVYEGEHEAIIEPEVFEKVRAKLDANREDHGSRVCNTHNALLKGLVRCTKCNSAMIHHAVTKKADPAARSPAAAKAKLYRYYACSKAMKHGWSSCPGPSLPADDLERFVVGKIHAVMSQEKVINAIARSAVERLTIRIGALLADPDEAMGLSETFEALWKGLNREERIDLIRLLVERIDWDAEQETVSVTFHEGVPLPEPEGEGSNSADQTESEEQAA